MLKSKRCPYCGQKMPREIKSINTVPEWNSLEFHNSIKSPFYNAIEGVQNPPQSVVLNAPKQLSHSESLVNISFKQSLITGILIGGGYGILSGCIVCGLIELSGLTPQYIPIVMAVTVGGIWIKTARNWPRAVEFFNNRILPVSEQVENNKPQHQEKQIVLEVPQKKEKIKSDSYREKRGRIQATPKQLREFALVVRRDKKNTDLVASNWTVGNNKLFSQPKYRMFLASMINLGIAKKNGTADNSKIVITQTGIDYFNNLDLDFLGVFND